MARKTTPDTPSAIFNVGIGYGQMEVRSLQDGRKLLVLPLGMRKANTLTWYELTPEQATWLSEELAK